MNIKQLLTLYTTPITPKIAEAIITNPRATVADLRTIQAMIGNTDGMGVAHPLYNAALEKEARLVLGGAK